MARPTGRAIRADSPTAPPDPRRAAGAPPKKKKTLCNAGKPLCQAGLYTWLYVYVFGDIPVRTSAGAARAEPLCLCVGGAGTGRYLLKPFDFARLLAAVNKVSDRLKSGSLVSADFFFVNAGAHKQRLVYQDLYYIESEGNYLNYVGKHGKTLVRSSIKEALELLPAQLFVQIHRSFLVSMAWIEKIEDHHVFIAQCKIAIGPTYREAFYKRITPSQKG